MKAEDFPLIPPAHRIEAAQWALQRGGHDFWSLTDSDPGYARGYACSCDPHFPDQRCPKWTCHREGQQCLAAKSDQLRCNNFVVPNTPFCSFHIDRAWRALLAQASIEAQAQLEMRLTWDKDKEIIRRNQMFKALELETALLWDAALAARQVGERVYFYLAQHAVKIGRSVRPEVRVKTLKGTLAPDGLDVNAGSLLGTIPGGAKVEGALHLRFRPHRIVGEWFTYAPIAEDVTEVLSEEAAA